MQEEDNEFFVLVLGVLAALLLVVSWWFTAGGAGYGTPQVATASSAPVAAAQAPVAGDTEPEADADADADSNDTAQEAEPEAVEEPAAEEPAAEEPAPALPSTVFDAVSDDPELSVLSTLLRDNELDQTLAGEGPFTVLAPSDDAINQAAGNDTTATLLASDPVNVLTYHVLPGEYTIEDLADIAQSEESAELMTVQGEPLSLSLDGDAVVVNGATRILPAAQQANNGFVYTLDNVLVPPVGALNTLVGLDPILFASGSATIEPASFATLDSFIGVLNSSDVDVTIEGHTDSSGDPILNQNLSEDRARSVLNYLVANGVDESRLDAEGFGADRPVADNETAEGRALNRRIEFTLG